MNTNVEKEPRMIVYLIMRNIGAYIEGRCVVNLCWMVCWQHDNGVKSILVCKETNIFSCFMIYNKSVKKNQQINIAIFLFSYKKVQN